MTELRSDVTQIGWRELSALTHARVGLGRVGVSTPTKHLLRFQADHALARDAVHATFQQSDLTAELQVGGFEVINATSMATSRASFLRRPELGRHTDERSSQALRNRARQHNEAGGSPWDVVFIISDGLSAIAVNEHATEVLRRCAELLRRRGINVGPIVIIPLGRVGLLNGVGKDLAARSAAILIGERPGLSAPDSLGAYFEFAPDSDLNDADRNCISNIRPGGLALTAGAQQLSLLICEGLTHGRSGTTLKVEYPAVPDVGRLGASSVG